MMINVWDAGCVFWFAPMRYSIKQMVRCEFEIAMLVWNAVPVQKIVQLRRSLYDQVSDVQMPSSTPPWGERTPRAAVSMSPRTVRTVVPNGPPVASRLLDPCVESG